ncbi:tetratricopeptide repeat protein [Ruegeria sp. 2012CJ41-6]|uniref:Tetratricopeptide repeat protein n=1 Tax=Ruegeria spongiae TaxID=2942209 RepID=A0ABT0Q696_9RHOB|nr:tetratricopeptide repeat protein [Ruegeria spongiae]MCL6285345.1 tetratricopeptide repeat protein [Ruegeria spongiae]
MRHLILIPALVAGGLGLSACVSKKDQAVERALQDVNVIDETGINDVMLTVGDPNEAVTYFQRATKTAPDRIDLQRGLAMSLVRAKRNTEGVSAWTKVVGMEGANEADSVELADAYIRNGDWKKAEETLDKVPPTHETFKRYRLEAMIADSNKEWKRADSFYETAVGLTTKPAAVTNNWGYSKLTRGQYAEAEKLFGEAIRQDRTLFTAKNNLVLARGAQGNYTLPVVPMNQVERAQLLHTMALTAIKQGDVTKGKTLLRDAVKTHPQHFEEAINSLRALESA